MDTVSQPGFNWEFVACETKKTQISLHIPQVLLGPLLFAVWKVHYLSLYIQVLIL